MCGIIGATSGTRKETESALQVFRYRGPDALGFFEQDGVVLGHARLSIIDLDARSNQPFFDEQHEIGVVFNGEIYNYKELRTELEREHKIRFRTDSDTEVLVYAYRVWGERALPRLRGMFAFCVYDLRSGTLFLARDHAGIKPLYYSLEHGRVAFASELKGVVALVRGSGISIEMDSEAIGWYTVFGYVPSPKTLVKGISKLERGSWLRYDLTTKKEVRGVWRPETRAITTRPELETAIKRSILEHCVADVPVGTFFSGGVDSSLIAAVLHESGADLETFSIRVSGRPADEHYFTEIAKLLGVKTHVADFGVKEFDSMYDDLLSLVDDPIADTSLFPTALVARLAAKKVKVVLSGEGGDELFLGYPRVLRVGRMRDSALAYSEVVDSVFFGMPAFRGKNRVFSSIASGLNLPASYYLLQTSPARDLSPSRAWRRAEEGLSSGDPYWYDRDWYLENMLLRKTDMATSYASIEGRVPLLGAELWNAAPAFVKENVVGGTGKKILKDMLAGYIPKELIERPKSGFGISIEAIFRDSKKASPGLHEALCALRDIGIMVDAGKEELLKVRYPMYGFGLVMLHRALKNLGII